MRPLTDARRDVLAAMESLPEARVALFDALGLVLAESVDAPHPVPPFDNSAMDGFAVRAADTADAPVTLRVLEDVAAGHLPTLTVGDGEAITIMTGAPMPAGADSIVIVEHTERPTPGTVLVKSAVTVGEHVRRSGGDLEAGERVFDAGERLGPQHLGVLASIGVAAPLVRRRPRVAIVSTGDEVLPPETTTLRPGTIRDANRPMLAGLLEDLGAEVVDLGIIPDDASALRAALERGAGECDAVLTSGGVSMGEYDLVKQVLTEMGHIDFWRVAMQPAKPFAFGFIDATPLFGLPGNPVSVTVAFEQFVRPALLHRMGAARLFRPRIRGRLGVAVRTNPDKVVFLRMQTRFEDGVWVATPSGGQQSNMLTALARADAFAVVPVGVGDLADGDEVDLEMFRWPEARTYEEVLG